MRGWKRVLQCVGAVAMAAGVGVTLGKKNGTDAGYSGGLSGLAQNCTACHPFNAGTGRVELIGAPRRYRAGEVYPLTVRVVAPEQDGAGFEISAEGAAGHEGVLLISDETHTQYADATPNYVTHTRAGVDDSIANWVGGRYDYHLEWQAPTFDAGPVTLFTAVNAIDNDFPGFGGVRFYSAYGTARSAIRGDGDGDTDLDLRDFALQQRCFSDLAPASGAECGFVDYDGDGSVSLGDVGDFVGSLTGPTASAPAEYVLADAVRGGQLYDKWWEVIRVPEPTGDHPLYPDFGQQTGGATFRCKECHGWDYKGRDGAYAAGAHFTDIVGVQDTPLTPQQIFDLLTSDSVETGGHDMDDMGLADRDIWDIVKMTLEGVIETDDSIDTNGAFLGSAGTGADWYLTVCASCHGESGDALNFGSAMDPEYVGTVAAQNPWEFIHKVRFAHPGSPMPALELLDVSAQIPAHIGAHAATLPQ